MRCKRGLQSKSLNRFTIARSNYLFFLWRGRYCTMLGPYKSVSSENLRNKKRTRLVRKAGKSVNKQNQTHTQSDPQIPQPDLRFAANQTEHKLQESNCHTDWTSMLQNATRHRSPANWCHPRPLYVIIPFPTPFVPSSHPLGSCSVASHLLSVALVLESLRVPNVVTSDREKQKPGIKCHGGCCRL